MNQETKQPTKQQTPTGKYGALIQKAKSGEIKLALRRLSVRQALSSPESRCGAGELPCASRAW